MCPKVGVVESKTATKVTTTMFDCKPLWAITPAMHKTLQQVPMFKKAIISHFAWSVIGEEVFIFCVPAILVTYVTWCLTWFTNTSLVYLRLPDTLTKCLSKNIPKERTQSISQIGYIGANGVGLDYSSNPQDVKRRANLHSVVHEFTPTDIEDIL